MPHTTAAQRILNAIRTAGTDGLTDEQIVSATGLPGDTVRPRRGELFAQFLVDELKHDGEPVMRRTRRGRQAQVWVAGSGCVTH